MAATTAALNAAATGLVAGITHIALVDDDGVELTGGSYARQAVSWASAAGGTVHPSANLTFAVPAGATVGGWRGRSAASSGTDFGGSDLTPEAYANAGTYILTAADTAFTVSAA